MGRIFKNLIPYWKAVVLTLLLLFVQASCDLALPAYTSDIIDVGIQNSGVSYGIPQAVTAEEYERAQVLMTEEEAQLWQSCYEADGDIYRCVLRGEDLEDADEILQPALLMNYQFSELEEDSFRSMLESSGVMSIFGNSFSLESLEKRLGIDLHITAREAETGDGTISEVVCLDIRPLFAMMQETGAIGEETMLTIRENIRETIDAMGSTMLHSMGVAYAVRCDEAAGLDLNQIQQRYLLTSGAKMVGMAFVMAIAAVLVGLLASRIGAGIGMTMRQSIFRQVVSFSSAEMDKFSTASLITRCTNDVQQVQMMTVMMIRMVAYAPILGVGGIIRVYRTGAGMGWVIGLAVLVILGFVAVLMAIAMPKFQMMQKLVDRVNLVSREILTGLSVIRAFGREQREEERFDDANKDLTKTMIFTNHVMNFMMPGMNLIMYGLSITIVWVAAHRIDLGVMQVGDMTAFLTYSMQIVMSFLLLTMLSVMLPRAAVAAKRIDEVMKTDSSIMEKEQTKKVSSGSRLQFKDVSFWYPGAKEAALSHINFAAEPGKTTAIIGSTGCGKSALVNLIPRLYDVTKGSITLDGVDIRDLSLKDLRDMIGFVPQKAVLFSGTIASNLRFGKHDAAESEIEEAAAIAQATDFISEKPEAFESYIAQGGSNVSGGQKQRLCIARAIVKEPKIYVFDDSFSALDLKTDAALRKALGAKTKEAAVIIVAQRISTILHADQILVLDDGLLVGKGTHEELMRSCDVYQQIARSQLSASELEGHVS